MDRILIILKKENGPRASSAPALGLNTIVFKYVHWYMKQISGERLQDHWSSGFNSVLRPFQDYFSSYETGQSVGGAKTGEPRKKTPDTPSSRTWLVSRGQSGSRTHTRHSSEMIE